MKKITRFAAIIVILGLMLAMPANAQSTAEPRGSAFFGSYGTDLYKTGTRVFQIWFDVVANAATMQVLGTSEIVLYRSADRQSWTKMRTYTMDTYTEMVDQNTSYHAGYVTYNYATPGYYYRARITFYAKNSTGIGERDVYTEILQM